MERGVSAEENPVTAYGFIGFFDFGIHGHTGHFQIEVGIASCHFQSGVDVNTVPMPHVDHNDIYIREPFCQQSNAPRQGIRCVTAVDENSNMQFSDRKSVV